MMPASLFHDSEHANLVLAISSLGEEARFGSSNGCNSLSSVGRCDVHIGSASILRARLEILLGARDKQGLGHHDVSSTVDFIRLRLVEASR
jgi:hypothetical protein